MASDAARLARHALELQNRVEAQMRDLEHTSDQNLSMVGCFWIDEIQATVHRLVKANARYDLLTDTAWEKIIRL
jgi:hypothetical protein